MEARRGGACERILRGFDHPDFGVRFVAIGRLCTELPVVMTELTDHALGKALSGAVDWQIAADLAQLANLYWYAADHPGQVDLAALFHERASFQIGTANLEGRQAIVDFFAQRATSMSAQQRSTWHFSGGCVLVPHDDGRIRVLSNVLVFAGTGDLPLASSLPSTIGECDDLCVRLESGRWVYERRSITTVMAGDAAPKFA